MKFEVGKFYTHGGGRQIAILGEVETCYSARIKERGPEAIETIQ